MAIAIRSPETLRMIEEICLRTGEDPQTVVLRAVQEQLARLPASNEEQSARIRTPEEETERSAGMHAVVREPQTTFNERSPTAAELIDELYDENGLPR
jgi:hypothetical protein